MSTFKEALLAKLAGHAGLSALVGTRIYPSVLDEDTVYPAGRFFVVPGNQFRHTQDGPAGLISKRVQFDWFADDPKGADAVAAQCRAALDGDRGAWSGVTICGVFVQSEFDNYEPEIEKYRVIQDFIIWHTE